MCDVLDDLDNREVRASVKEKVLALCAKYPVYQQA
jgi:glycine/serine hydroxymethyltransferase